MDVYSPADSADHAEECSKLHYPAEKDRLFEVVAVVAVLLFWGFVCVNQRDLRENRPFTHTKNMSMNIKNNNNGRSRVSRGNKIQKLRKVFVKS